MWLLFIPFALVLGVLVLLGAVGAVFGALGGGWPWLLIALGVWLFWHEDGHHRRARHRPRDWAPMPEPAPAQGPDRKRRAKTGETDAPGPRPLRQTELPIDVKVKVEQIKRKVDVLLSYADRFPPFSQDLYLVRQTASDYLPRTINAYLAMPKETAQRPMQSGQTPYQELKAQLDLLDAKLDDIAQDLQRQDTDRLLANRKFLEDRFGLRNTPSPLTEAAEVA
jgi:hypothetical protein